MSTIQQILCMVQQILLHLTYYFTIKKNKKTIQMFFGNFSNEGDNPVSNPNIFNVEGDNMSLHGQFFA